MFDVLVYVYENYWQGDACPEWSQLERTLSTLGFEPEEIEGALYWLDGLYDAVQSQLEHPELQHPASMRVYLPREQEHLGEECLGYLGFLEASGLLPPFMREVVVDRAMVLPSEYLSREMLRLILRMAYWSFGTEPQEHLVLSELSDDGVLRVLH
jgi:Smg protein